MNAFEERLYKSVPCYPHLYDSSPQDYKDTKLLNTDQVVSVMQPGPGYNDRRFSPSLSVAIRKRLTLLLLDVVGQYNKFFSVEITPLRDCCHAHLIRNPFKLFRKSALHSVF